MNEIPRSVTLLVQEIEASRRRDALARIVEQERPRHRRGLFERVTAPLRRVCRVGE